MKSWLHTNVIPRRNDEEASLVKDINSGWHDLEARVIYSLR